MDYCEFDSLLVLFFDKKKKAPVFLQVLCGDPDENRQGFALTICFANILFYVPFGSALGEPPKDGLCEFDSLLVSFLKQKEKAPVFLQVLCGDPDENRTRVTAVKGRCLNRLTTGPYMRGLKPFYENTSVGRCVELVAAVGFEPTTNRV